MNSLSLCPNNAVTFTSVGKIYENEVNFEHSVCHSDCFSFGMSLEDCACPDVLVYTKTKYFVVCKVDSINDGFSSEKTAITKNALISESNSKLGSIASINSTSTNLLQQIKDSLSALLTKNYGVFGTGTVSSSSGSSGANSLNPKNDPNSAEYEPTLSSSETDVSAISLEKSVVGSCPANFPIHFIRGSTYTTQNLSFQPFCDFLENVRPIVIAAARVGAAWLVIGAL
jgi:hypothetical protein